MVNTIHMETPDVEDQEGQDEDPAPVHYSTGRLTRGQAALVNTWRARLLLDRPLPRRDRVSKAARLLGMDDRPPASCSDIIAAAVAELLRQPPDGLDLARYAHAGWQTQRAAGRGNGDDDRAPLYPPVSFYLGGELTEQYEALRARAAGSVQEVRRELDDEAARRYPDEARQAGERAAWLAAEMTRRGLPAHPRKIPGGAAARMAIDRWARRSADRVCADAVAYAADAHGQPHRGRRDMYELRR
jgi:hypothetical protein